MSTNTKPFTYEDLDVYQAGLDVAEAMYRLAALLPKSEQYGLISQLHRASVSISTNIAEGWGRGPGAANAQFVRISRGSIYELVTLVNLCQRLGYIGEAKASEFKPLLDRTGKLIQRYLASLEKNLVREERAEYAVSDARDCELQAANLESRSLYESPIANSESR